MTKIDLAEILETLKKQGPIFHQPELGLTHTAFENMTVEDFWEVGASDQRYN